MQAEYLQIGEIVRPQGIRGEVKLRAMTSDPGRYARLETVYLAENGGYRAVRVLSGRAQQGFAYLKLEGVFDRNQAEALRGRAVFVDRAHAIELGEDENFVCDLIGLQAVDTQGEPLGTLRDVLTPNAVCDVYVFDTPRGELMIPALRRVVREVDLDAGRIVLDEAVLPEVAVWEDEPAERDE
ncbi:MAG: ribosome maturation factor RimM [Candidatus Ventricola sp.]